MIQLWFYKKEADRLRAGGVKIRIIKDLDGDREWDMKPVMCEVDGWVASIIKVFEDNSSRKFDDGKPDRGTSVAYEEMEWAGMDFIEFIIKSKPNDVTNG